MAKSYEFLYNLRAVFKIPKDIFLWQRNPVIKSKWLLDIKKGFGITHKTPRSIIAYTLIIANNGRMIIHVLKAV